MQGYVLRITFLCRIQAQIAQGVVTLSVTQRIAYLLQIVHVVYLLDELQSVVNQVFTLHKVVELQSLLEFFTCFGEYCVFVGEQRGAHAFQLLVEIVRVDLKQSCV